MGPENGWLLSEIQNEHIWAPSMAAWCQCKAPCCHCQDDRHHTLKRDFGKFDEKRFNESLGACFCWDRTWDRWVIAAQMHPFHAKSVICRGMAEELSSAMMRACSELTWINPLGVWHQLVAWGFNLSIDCETWMASSRVENLVVGRFRSFLVAENEKNRNSSAAYDTD